MSYSNCAEDFLFCSLTPQLYTCIQKFSFCARVNFAGDPSAESMRGRTLVEPRTNIPAPTDLEGTFSITSARISVEETNPFSSLMSGTRIPRDQVPIRSPFT